MLSDNRLSNPDKVKLRGKNDWGRVRAPPLAQQRFRRVIFPTCLAMRPQLVHRGKEFLMNQPDD